MNNGGGNVVTSIASYVMTHSPNKAIGFIAGDLFDTNRSALYPSPSSSSTRPRRITRTRAVTRRIARTYATDTTGLGPGALLRQGRHSGVPTSAAAAKFLGATFGTMYSTAFNYVELQSLAGVIPQCAMKVTRDDDGILGPIKPKTDNTNPCGCAFEKFGTGITTCTACPNGNSDCTGGKTCHFGYCE